MSATPRAGASRYMVEPNIKEGKGGLRDLHTLFWMARHRYGFATPHDYVAAGVFSSGGLRQASAARSNSSGPCAATCTSSPAARKSG